MDSLRYWLTEMRVDGFRFDLAPTLAREHGGFDRLSAFFDLVSQDPVVSRAKLIAEPWDVGQADSYDIGRFPPLWREWNGRYRDTMRDFWRSHDGLLGEFATRFAGSSDLYGDAGRRPTASVNLITVHDGFTLADLVSYDTKHNEANGEGNRDGTDDNRSWNCGVEGPTDDASPCALRGRQQPRPAHHAAAVVRRPDAARRRRARPHPAGQQQRLLPGQRDHLVRLVHVDEDLLAFTRQLIALPAAHPVFRRRRFLSGADRSTLRWYTPAGTIMTADATGPTPAPAASPSTSTAQDAPDRAADGSPLIDDDFLVLVNAWWEPLDFVLPAICAGQQWVAEIDTFEPSAVTAARQAARG